MATDERGFELDVKAIGDCSRDELEKHYKNLLIENSTKDTKIRKLKNALEQYELIVDGKNISSAMLRDAREKMVNEMFIQISQSIKKKRAGKPTNRAAQQDIQDLIIEYKKDGQGKPFKTWLKNKIIDELKLNGTNVQLPSVMKRIDAEVQKWATRKTRFEGEANKYK